LAFGECLEALTTFATFSFVTIFTLTVFFGVAGLATTFGADLLTPFLGVTLEAMDCVFTTGGLVLALTAAFFTALGAAFAGAFFKGIFLAMSGVERIQEMGSGMKYGELGGASYPSLGQLASEICFFLGATRWKKTTL
jgi:hypothetical protein